MSDQTPVSPRRRAEDALGAGDVLPAIAWSVLAVADEVTALRREVRDVNKKPRR